MIPDEEKNLKLRNRTKIGLINCPACEQRISVQAPACPHCGQPLKFSEHLVEHAKESNASMKMLKRLDKLTDLYMLQTSQYIDPLWELFNKASIDEIVKQRSSILIEFLKNLPRLRCLEYEILQLHSFSCSLHAIHNIVCRNCLHEGAVIPCAIAIKAEPGYFFSEKILDAGTTILCLECGHRRQEETHMAYELCMSEILGTRYSTDIYSPESHNFFGPVLPIYKVFKNRFPISSENEDAFQKVFGYEHQLYSDSVLCSVASLSFKSFDQFLSTINFENRIKAPEYQSPSVEDFLHAVSKPQRGFWSSLFS